MKLAFDQRCLEGGSPLYILDLSYRFVWWNWAFDETIAKPLGLKLFMQATNWLRHLDNRRECLERSARVFAVDNVPLHDMEPLIVTIEPYGKIDFRKIAYFIPQSSDEETYWVVQLAVDRVENPEPFWDAINERMGRELGARS